MTTAQQLDERYGRGRTRRLPWIIAIVVAVAIVAVYGWMTVSNAMDDVTVDDLGFELVDERSVSVRYQVTLPAEREIVCVLEALDEQFGIVGWKVVRIPASAQVSQAITTVVPTVGKATTGLVNACWAA